MSEAAIMDEFPFVADMPKKEKSRRVQVLEQFAAYKATIEKSGFPIPQVLAAKIAGVTKARIGELIKLKRLQVVELDGHVFVTENSLVEYASGERKAGRPSKFIADCDKQGPFKATIKLMTNS